MVRLRLLLVGFVALRNGISLVAAARHEDLAELLDIDSDTVGRASELGLSSAANTSKKADSVDGAHRSEGTHGHHKDSAADEVEDHDHHHPFTSLDIAVGACFVGFVVIMMSALFLVNHSDHDVRAEAYSMVSQTLSIFCAVTIDSQVDEGIEKLHLSFWNSVAVRVLFGLALAIAVFVKVARSDSKVPMIATGVFGGHMVGYAALEALGSVQQHARFVEHVVLTVVASALLSYFMLKATLWLAEHVVQGSGEETREEKMEVIDDSEEEAFSFCNGFLLSQASKCYVLGSMPKLHGEPRWKSKQDCTMLFGFVGLYSLLVCVLGLLEDFAHGRGLSGTARLISLAQRTAGMAAAWILVFAGEWLWFATVKTPSLSSGIMLVTFVNTMVSFGLVIALDFVADREWVRPASVRAVIAIIATAVGLSWEKAFHEANEALTSGLSQQHAPMCRGLLIAAVLLIVLQGWRYYILPEAIEHKEQCGHMKNAEESHAEDGSERKSLESHAEDGQKQAEMSTQSAEESRAEDGQKQAEMSAQSAEESRAEDGQKQAETSAPQ